MAGGRQKGTVKTGGRKKGTPNKSTQTVRDLFEKHNFDPLEEAIKIAKGEVLWEVTATDDKGRILFDPKTRIAKTIKVLPSETIRAKFHQECIDRQYAKLRSIELTGNVAPLEVIIKTKK